MRSAQAEEMREGEDGATAGGGQGSTPTSPVDLRDVLREKAAIHRSFYKRLREEKEKNAERGESPATPLPLHGPTPAPRTLAALSLPAAMSGAGGLLSPPGRESPRSTAGSDEGCPGAADCSSDEEERRPARPDRPRSRDSAVDLDETPNMTVLSDALIQITPEEKLSGEPPCFDSASDNVFDDSFEKRDYCEEHCCYHVRSRMILEAQYVEYPFTDRKCSFEESGETDLFAAKDARRQSTLSWDGDEISRVRMVRTPSVVVSDYSDDIHAGITPEELEYLRKHVEAASNSSSRSSCSNLDSRCGSQLSVLDGEDSRRSSQLSVGSLDEVKTEVSPLVSEGEDDDSGLGKQENPKKMASPQ